jgi:A/G-specific adenine glycosylase
MCSHITATDRVDKEGDVLRPVPVARLKVFRTIVWDYYRKNGRHDLPWRKTTDPYKILVSEVMLQQTQVSRVIEKYRSFLKRFPNVRALAKAPLSEVLKEWSGLGYNRRGKYLHDAAKEIVAKYRGNFEEALRHQLPGVGPYTKAAVRAFAFNESGTLIETNIRAAAIHHFFPTSQIISDKRLLGTLEESAKGQDPREWHWALMDYGAHLKKSGVRNNQQSAHYAKQSKFEGSLRQIRGATLRALHNSSSTERQISGRLSLPLLSIKEALEGLALDGLIVKKKGRWSIA